MKRSLVSLGEPCQPRSRSMSWIEVRNYIINREPVDRSGVDYVRGSVRHVSYPSALLSHVVCKANLDIGTVECYDGYGLSVVTWTMTKVVIDYVVVGPVLTSLVSYSEQVITHKLIKAEEKTPYYEEQSFRQNEGVVMYVGEQEEGEEEGVMQGEKEGAKEGKKEVEEEEERGVKEREEEAEERGVKEKEEEGIQEREESGVMEAKEKWVKEGEEEGDEEGDEKEEEEEVKGGKEERLEEGLEEVLVESDDKGEGEGVKGGIKEGLVEGEKEGEEENDEEGDEKGAEVLNNVMSRKKELEVKKKGKLPKRMEKVEVEYHIKFGWLQKIRNTLFGRKSREYKYDIKNRGQHQNIVVLDGNKRLNDEEYSPGIGEKSPQQNRYDDEMSEEEIEVKEKKGLEKEVEWKEAEEILENSRNSNEKEKLKSKFENSDTEKSTEKLKESNEMKGNLEEQRKRMKDNTEQLGRIKRIRATLISSFRSKKKYRPSVVENCPIPPCQLENKRSNMMCSLECCMRKERERDGDGVKNVEETRKIGEQEEEQWDEIENGVKNVKQEVELKMMEGRKENEKEGAEVQMRERGDENDIMKEEENEDTNQEWDKVKWKKKEFKDRKGMLSKSTVNEKEENPMKDSWFKRVRNTVFGQDDKNELKVGMPSPYTALQDVSLGIVLEYMGRERRKWWEEELEH